MADPANAPDPNVSYMPLTFERARDPENPTAAGNESLQVFVPAERQVAQVVDGTAPGDMAKAIAAGRTCDKCRYFMYEAGQRKFTSERLWQGVVRELAHNPEWWNPLDFGICGIERRTATHKTATCEMFVPQSRLVSFFGKLTAK